MSSISKSTMKDDLPINFLDKFHVIDAWSDDDRVVDRHKKDRLSSSKSNRKDRRKSSSKEDSRSLEHRKPTEGEIDEFVESLKKANVKRPSGKDERFEKYSKRGRYRDDSFSKQNWKRGGESERCGSNERPSSASWKETSKHDLMGSRNEFWGSRQDCDYRRNYEEYKDRSRSVDQKSDHVDTKCDYVSYKRGRIMKTIDNSKEPVEFDRNSDNEKNDEGGNENQDRRFVFIASKDTDIRPTFCNQSKLDSTRYDSERHELSAKSRGRRYVTEVEDLRLALSSSRRDSKPREERASRSPRFKVSIRGDVDYRRSRSDSSERGYKNVSLSPENVYRSRSRSGSNNRRWTNETIQSSWPSQNNQSIVDRRRFKSRLLDDGREKIRQCFEPNDRRHDFSTKFLSESDIQMAPVPHCSSWIGNMPMQYGVQPDYATGQHCQFYPYTNNYFYNQNNMPVENQIPMEHYQGINNRFDLAVHGGWSNNAPDIVSFEQEHGFMSGNQMNWPMNDSGMTMNAGDIQFSRVHSESNENMGNITSVPSSSIPSPPPPPTLSEHEKSSFKKAPMKNSCFDADNSKTGEGGTANHWSKLLEDKSVSLSCVLESSIEKEPKVNMDQVKKDIVAKCESKIKQLYRKRIGGVGCFMPDLDPKKNMNNKSPIEFWNHSCLDYNKPPEQKVWRYSNTDRTFHLISNSTFLKSALVKKPCNEGKSSSEDQETILPLLMEPESCDSHNGSSLNTENNIYSQDVAVPHLDEICALNNTRNNTAAVSNPSFDHSSYSGSNYHHKQQSQKNSMELNESSCPIGEYSSNINKWYPSHNGNYSCTSIQPSYNSHSSVAECIAPYSEFTVSKKTSNLSNLVKLKKTPNMGNQTMPKNISNLSNQILSKKTSNLSNQLTSKKTSNLSNLINVPTSPSVPSISHKRTKSKKQKDKEIKNEHNEENDSESTTKNIKPSEVSLTFSRNGAVYIPIDVFFSDDDLNIVKSGRPCEPKVPSNRLKNLIRSLQLRDEKCTELIQLAKTDKSQDTYRMKWSVLCKKHNGYKIMFPEKFRGKINGFISLMLASYGTLKLSIEALKKYFIPFQDDYEAIDYCIYRLINKFSKRKKFNGSLWHKIAVIDPNSEDAAWDELSINKPHCIILDKSKAHVSQSLELVDRFDVDVNINTAPTFDPCFKVEQNTVAECESQKEADKSSSPSFCSETGDKNEHNVKSTSEKPELVSLSTKVSSSNSKVTGFDFSKLKRKIQDNQTSSQSLKSIIDSLNKGDSEVKKSYLLKGGLLCKMCNVEGADVIRIAMTDDSVEHVISIVHAICEPHASIERTSYIMKKYFSPVTDINSLVNKVIKECKQCG